MRFELTLTTLTTLDTASYATTAIHCSITITYYL